MVQCQCNWNTHTSCVLKPVVYPSLDPSDSEPGQYLNVPGQSVRQVLGCCSITDHSHGDYECCMATITTRGPGTSVARDFGC